MKIPRPKLYCQAFILVGCLFGLCLTSFAQITTPATGTSATAATPSTTAPAALPTSNSVMANIARAEAAGNANDLVLAYGDAVRDPQLARSALTQLLTDYFRLRSLATSAMQASQAVDEAALRFAIFQAAQNQVNVQQNQQLLAQHQKLIEQNEAIIKQNERMIAIMSQIARTR
jgi:hypothetical protein